MQLVVFVYCFAEKGLVMCSRARCFHQCAVSLVAFSIRAIPMGDMACSSFILKRFHYIDKVKIFWEVLIVNKEKLNKIMCSHGDRCKDLAATIGMSVPNFSTIWNGRSEFSLKYIRKIAKRYYLSPEEIYDIFIFPGK